MDKNVSKYQQEVEKLKDEIQVKNKEVEAKTQEIQKVIYGQKMKIAAQAKQIESLKESETNNQE